MKYKEKSQGRDTPYVLDTRMYRESERVGLMAVWQQWEYLWLPGLALSGAQIPPPGYFLDTT